MVESIECPTCYYFLNFCIAMKTTIKTGGATSFISPMAHYSDHFNENNFNNINNNCNKPVENLCSLLNCIEKETYEQNVDDDNLVKKLLESHNIEVMIDDNETELTEFEKELLIKYSGCNSITDNDNLNNNNYNNNSDIVVKDINEDEKIDREKIDVNLLNESENSLKIQQDDVENENLSNLSKTEINIINDVENLTLKSISNQPDVMMEIDASTQCNKIDVVTNECNNNSNLLINTTPADICSTSSECLFNSSNISRLSNTINNNNNNNNHLINTRNINERRNRDREIRRNFSMWVGVTSCVWGLLLYFAKTYHT